MFEQEAAQQAREEMNLLYVAMTRAKQALVVSGNGHGEEKERNKKSQSWYDRIAAAAERADAQAPARHDETSAPFSLRLSKGERLGAQDSGRTSTSSGQTGGAQIVIPPILPTGKRRARNTREQQRGIWLHALLQHLTSPLPLAGEGPGERVGEHDLQRRLAIPHAEMETLWRQAQALLANPQLARFYDASAYRRASNEMPYLDAAGEPKRIDRLVEFDSEVWVLDYKLGDSEDAARHRAQMQEYRAAMQAVYAGKAVRCVLVFADGVVKEL
jgi:ATP-dependent helicase/nuclease subunit A